jgi:aspartate ammonia-lyase
MRRGVEHSIGIVTALNPYIGYANATEIAREALLTGRSVYDLVLEKKLLTPEQLNQILQPEVLTKPRSFGTGFASAKSEAAGPAAGRVE